MQWKLAYRLACMFIGPILLAGLLFSAGLAGCKKDTPTSCESPSADEPKQVTDANTTVTMEAAIQQDSTRGTGTVEPNAIGATWLPPRSSERLEERRQMVRHIEHYYNFNNSDVLSALEQVPRHWFVTAPEQKRAYANMPLPIGHGQTISQPFIVAYMTDLLDLDRHKTVLEVGTGSGYQAAVLTEFTTHVYTIEIVEPLARAATDRLRELGYDTIETMTGDGYWGWADKGPFDAIIVTCAADHIPPPLIEQLKPGGKMCIPVGGTFRVQHLMLISKDQDGEITSQSLMPVRFVPFVRGTNP